MISKNKVLKIEMHLFLKKFVFLNENSSFKNPCSFCEIIQKLNNFLKENIACFEKEKEPLRTMILKWDKDNNVLKENTFCAIMENESLKQKGFIS